MDPVGGAASSVTAEDAHVLWIRHKPEKIDRALAREESLSSFALHTQSTHTHTPTFPAPLDIGSIWRNPTTNFPSAGDRVLLRTQIRAKERDSGLRRKELKGTKLRRRLPCTSSGGTMNVAGGYTMDVSGWLVDYGEVWALMIGLFYRRA